MAAGTGAGAGTGAAVCSLRPFSALPPSVWVLTSTGGVLFCPRSTIITFTSLKCDVDVYTLVKELPAILDGWHRMAYVDPHNVLIKQEDVILLDQSLRIAYTHLMDARVVNVELIHSLRDVLVTTIVGAMLKGEKDQWRLARRAIFAASAVLAGISTSRMAAVVIRRK